MKHDSIRSSVVLSLISLGFLVSSYSGTALAQKNPCAAKPAGSGANPCAAANPCSANPCGVGVTSAKAMMVTGEIGTVDGAAKKIVVKRPGGPVELMFGPRTLVRQGAQVANINDLKAGDKVTVSYVDTGKERTLWYVYAASQGTVANPCGGNPCAAKNPCAANPCVAKNPCAANPCGSGNPCRGR